MCYLVDVLFCFCRKPWAAITYWMTFANTAAVSYNCFAVAAYFTCLDIQC